MKKITILDTTLRDGAQGIGISFSLEDKIRIAQILDDLGINYIEAGWPGSNNKDMAFFKKIKNNHFKSAKISAFSSTKRPKIKIEKDENIRKLLNSGASVFTIFGKSWDFHVKKALEVNLEENLEMIYLTINYLKKNAEEVIYDAEHFFDGYKSNPEYALKTIRVAEEASADIIVLADTNGGSMWYEIEEIVDAVSKKVSKLIGIHAHNDTGLAIANTLAAVRKGATHIQGTINGIGERCGNADLCCIIPNLSFKMNVRSIPEEKLKMLTNLSSTVSELLNKLPNKNNPYVGEYAFAHKGGVHVSAMIKDQTMYEHINPKLVGNKRYFSVSELSGQSNIIAKANELGYSIEKNSTLVKKLLKQIKELEADGYHFEAADASLELLYFSLLKEKLNFFTLRGFKVLVWKDSDDDRAKAEASIKVDVPAEVAIKQGLEQSCEHTSADGNGPVEALDKALRKVLEKFYPTLKSVRLVDYKVRILDEQNGTKAITRVLINFTDGAINWSTVGVSDNILEASWIALTDAFKYKLLKDSVSNQK